MKIKIISLNIWHGFNLPAVIAFLQAGAAEVVVLQEVYNSSDPGLADKYRSYEILRERLGYEHAAFAEAYQENLPGIKIPHGNAIFSAFPITSSSVTYLVDPIPDFDYWDKSEHWPILPAPLQQAELATPVGPVNIFNMHGVWDLQGDSYSERRQHMSRSLIAATIDKPNVILAGDSNAKATNQAMHNLEKHLKAVFGSGLKTTFNMRRKDNPGYATAAVDLMYVSPAIEVISANCLDVDISDHLPVVATLQIPRDET